MSAEELAAVKEKRESAKEKREAAKEQREETKDALAVLKYVSSALYIASVGAWSALLYQRYSTLAVNISLARTIAESPSSMPLVDPNDFIKGMGFEMILGFTLVTICHGGFIISHTVKTTAPRLKKLFVAFTITIMCVFTVFWMVVYTCRIPPILFRQWMWIVTVVFLVINLSMSLSFGIMVCRGGATLVAGGAAAPTPNWKLSFGALIFTIFAPTKTKVLHPQGKKD